MNNPTPPPDTKVQSETLEQIAEELVARWQEDLRLAKYERHSSAGDTAAAAPGLRTRIISALRNERERCAKVPESRADELQAEWDAPPSAENGFIAMTADTPAGYATYYCMNQLRKLATSIRGEPQSDDEWWSEVLRICKDRKYAEWFSADREAWLELKTEMTPLQAVEYQVECLF